MDDDITTLRQGLIQAILRKQDHAFRWGFDARQAREKPEYLYYSPNFRSTLWTLVALADLKAPPGLDQVDASLRLVSEHFYSPAEGIFRLPNNSHFPIPCLNGNLLYLHHIFGLAAFGKAGAGHRLLCRPPALRRRGFLTPDGLPLLR